MDASTAGESSTTGASGPYTIFVTSQVHHTDGDLGGISGGDDRCRLAGMAGGLPDGTYVAVLSTSTTDVRDRPELQAAQPVLNGKGEMVVSDVSGLWETVTTPLMASVGWEADGSEGQADAWTGTLCDGRVSSISGTARTCGDWLSSNSAVVGAMGGAFSMQNTDCEWIGTGGGTGCYQFRGLYCILQGG